MLSPGKLADMTVIFFPFAGGSGNVFTQWQRHFSERISVRSIQLPGRGPRIKEPLIRSWPEMREALLGELRSVAERPFAFFGHSFGARLAYDIAVQLHRENRRLPDHLFVSAHRAPHLSKRGAPIAGLDDYRFIEEIRHLNGTPDQVIENRELMALMLPSLRADICLSENPPSENADPLPCPIVALAGRADKFVFPGEMLPWGQHTKSRFTFHEFDGDHFYLLKHPESISKIIENYIST